MKSLKNFAAVGLIVLGPVLIVAIGYEAFKNIGENNKLSDAIPWLLLASFIIPVGMSISVIGFLTMKGEFDKNY